MWRSVQSLKNVKWCWVGLLVAIAGLSGNADAKTSPQYQDSVLQTIAHGQLPKQGQETYALIRKGGPFPYAKDGVVFGNRERLLPKAPRGYYHEYTVKTPYARDRGARRIICGSKKGQQMAPEICYYTDDHYASFRQIVQQ